MSYFGNILMKVFNDTEFMKMGRSRFEKIYFSRNIVIKGGDT